MATAISFTSESSDHYLEIFDKKESPTEIVLTLEERFGEEWAYVSADNVESTDLSTKQVNHLQKLMNKSRSEAYDAVDY